MQEKGCRSTALKLPRGAAAFVLWRERTPAPRLVLVFVCLLSPLPHALYKEAAFVLSEKSKALLEVGAKVCWSWL